MPEWDVNNIPCFILLAYVHPRILFIPGSMLGEKVKVLVAQSCLTLCNPMNCSCQASLSMEFSRQKYWSGLPFPSPGDLPNSGIEPGSPALQADFLPSEPPGKKHGTNILKT